MRTAYSKKVRRALTVLTAAAALILASAFAFTGCSSDNERTEVIVWHSWNVEEGGTEHELKAIVDDYNASQDKVNVVLQAQPSQGCPFTHHHPSLF